MQSGSSHAHLKKAYKQFLWRQRLIDCHICPLNRKENSNRRQRDDRQKNHRRR